MYPSIKIESPRQLGLGRGPLGTLVLLGNLQSQVTCARDVAYSSDNRPDSSFSHHRHKADENQLPTREDIQGCGFLAVESKHDHVVPALKRDRGAWIA
jgi:hypothetical protein